MAFLAFFALEPTPLQILSSPWLQLSASSTKTSPDPNTHVTGWPLWHHHQLWHILQCFQLFLLQIAHIACAPTFPVLDKIEQSHMHLPKKRSQMNQMPLATAVTTLFTPSTRKYTPTPWTTYISSPVTYHHRLPTHWLDYPTAYLSIALQIRNSKTPLNKYYNSQSSLPQPNNTAPAVLNSTHFLVTTFLNAHGFAKLVLITSFAMALPTPLLQLSSPQDISSQTKQ